MRLTTLLLICLISLVVSSVSYLDAAEQVQQSQQSSQIATAVKRSLPYLKEQGKWWLTNKKCASCHRLTFLPQILRETSRRGISDESESLDYWTKQLLKVTNKKSNLIGLSQLILGRDRNTAANEKVYQQFATILVKGQKKDGSWRAEGQLPKQKRPASESVEVATMWNLLALGTMPPQKELTTAYQKALDYIKTKKEGTSTEWHVTRLLIELQSNEINSKSTNQRLKQLLRHQNTDGGWGWITGEKSDALATGLALYTLSELKLNRENIAIDKAIDWLLKTQTKEGHWLVLGTKEKKKTKPQETSNYWGTIWATLGLLQTLPEKETKLSQK